VIHIFVYREHTSNSLFFGKERTDGWNYMCNSILPNHTRVTWKQELYFSYVLCGLLIICKNTLRVEQDYAPCSWFYKNDSHFPYFFAINFNINVSHIIHIKASTLLFLISVNLAILKGWVEKNRIRGPIFMIYHNMCDGCMDRRMDVHTDRRMSGRTDEITCVTLYYPHSSDMIKIIVFQLCDNFIKLSCNWHVKSSSIYPPPTYEVIYIIWPSSYDWFLQMISKPRST
jgi:hypothetical protein